MSDPEFAIETRGLCKEYADRVVLRRIDLALTGGRIVCFMGSNGAGKTTLLRCLASLSRPTSGEVRWFGDATLPGLSVRRRIGMVAHETRLYPQLTLRENLVFAARMHGLDQPLAIANHWLASVRLDKHANRLPQQVSQGMRQRISLARGLLHDPRILLLDEPFAGLDESGASWLSERLGELRDDGRLVCLTTHDAAKADELADHVWTLQYGTLCHGAWRHEAIVRAHGRAARAA